MSVMDQLRTRFHANAQLNLLVTAELLKILALFERHALIAIPYKGPVLAASVYGNLALREFTDLDVLVRKQDIPKARELLNSLGYRQHLHLADGQEAAFLHAWGEYVYVHGDNGTVVELHWALAKRHHSWRLGLEDLWGNLERLSFGGNSVLTPSPENLLLILCMHGSKHLWERLGWICDVAELIRGNKRLRWHPLLERAGAVGTERMLLLGLLLASSLLEAPLPEEVLRKAWADPKVQMIAERVRGRLFGEADTQKNIFKNVCFEADLLRLRERWQDKIRYCTLTMVTPSVEDLTFLRLPKPFWPLYYVTRPIRLTGKYARTVPDWIS